MDEKMTVNSTKFFKFGDRVVHLKRPEWGHGTITKVDAIQHEGEAAQRLHVRFSGVGLKVMNTAFAPLAAAKEVERFSDEAEGDADGAQEMPVATISRNGNGSTNGKSRNGRGAVRHQERGRKDVMIQKSDNRSGSQNGNGSMGQAKGWLASLESRDPEAVMLDIPENAKDPFRSEWDRLQDSIDLYRFNSSHRSVLDWAIAQSGLEDPLTKFNRQELETFFMRWTRIRDQHLFTVLLEAEKLDRGRAAKMLAAAPQNAQQAMRRLYARR